VQTVAQWQMAENSKLVKTVTVVTITVTVAINNVWLKQ
jgi:hypothetical protein